MRVLRPKAAFDGLTETYEMPSNGFVAAADYLHGETSVTDVFVGKITRN